MAARFREKGIGFAEFRGIETRVLAEHSLARDASLVCYRTCGLGRACLCKGCRFDEMPSPPLGVFHLEHHGRLGRVL